MTNMNAIQQAAFDALRAIAIGEARGATSLTSYALKSAADVAGDIWEAADAARLYEARFGWINAERAEIGREPVKVPTGKSLATQVAKFRAFLDLGEVARSRGTMLKLLATAAQSCGNKYKPMVAGASAARAALAKSPGISDEDLLGVITAAMEGTAPEPETASDAFEKIATAWDKLRKAHPTAFDTASVMKPGLVDDTATLLARMGKVLAAVDAQAAMLDF